MSKLPEGYAFLDLSDYGRSTAKIIAKSLKETAFTPIHITLCFVIAGFIAILCILLNQLILAALFLIIKSILDAADGELARIKNTPSYTGRYLDSVSDIVLNFFIILAIWYTTEISILYAFLAFVGIQLQGTLYNYYYVILRNNLNGDNTSRVFEHKIPIAFKGESQKNVTLLFRVYILFYGLFDKIIYSLDSNASESTRFPKLFMTLLSIFGLGFQLLIIGVFLVLGYKEFIFIFFIWFSILIPVFIGIRKLL